MTLGGFAHRTQAAAMILGRAVGKVQPHHVDADTDEFVEYALAIAGGAQGGDDLGAAKGGMAVQVRHEKLLTARYCLYKGGNDRPPCKVLVRKSTSTSLAVVPATTCSHFTTS